MESLRGKVVIVTGSSTGIGRATAIAFAKHHAKVVLTARNEDELKNTKRKCSENGGKFDNVTYITADITTEEGAQSIIKEALSTFGRIDVLVNNAGIGITGDVKTTTMEQFDDLFNTNVRSVFRLTQLAMPHLKNSKGCIINVSSVYADRPCTDMSAYSMTKAAINMFTDSLALELAPHKVRVNSVSPGEIGTAMQAKMGVKESEMEQYFKDTAKLHPLKKNGEPSEVANVIIFLASEAASFMTGAKIPVDGGQSVTASWFSAPSESTGTGFLQSFPSFN